METKKVSIYGLIDPRNNQLRYVGMSGNPHKRFLYHCGEGANGKQTMKARWISGLLNAGLLPRWFVIEESDAEGWKEAEQFWIAYFKSLGSRLLNMTSGGEGTLNFSHSEETRRKMRASQAGRKLSQEQIAKIRGRIVPSDVRKKISEKLKGRGPDKATSEKIRITLTGRSRPEDVKSKISAAHKGKKLSAQHIEKIAETKRSKPFCKRGHPRDPGSRCRICENIRAAMYRAGSSVSKKE